MYYQPQAFILSEEAALLTENLRCLNGVDFKWVIIIYELPATCAKYLVYV